MRDKDGGAEDSARRGRLKEEYKRGRRGRTERKRSRTEEERSGRERSGGIGVQRKGNGEVGRLSGGKTEGRENGA